MPRQAIVYVHFNYGQVYMEIQYNLATINHRSRIELCKGLECPILIFLVLGEWVHSLDHRLSQIFYLSASLCASYDLDDGEIAI